MNCPAPINSGIATPGNPSFIAGGIVINYTVSYDNSLANNYNGSFFDCTIVNNAPAFTIAIKPYGKSITFGSIQVINTGWFAWVGDTIWSYLDNIQPFLTMVYLFVIIPSAVGALTFFSYINIFLLIMLTFGLYLAVRG